MSTHIVKVQRAIEPPGGPALIYAEGRRHLVTRALTAREDQLMGPALKAYFNATWSPIRHHWTLHTKAEDQSW